MTRVLLGIVVGLAVGCQNEKVGTVSGPPLLIAQPDGAPPPLAGTAARPSAARSAVRDPEARGPDAGLPEPFCAVNASFLEVGKVATRVEHVACETRAVIVVRGTVSARLFYPQNRSAEDRLAAGDVLLTQGRGHYDLSGDGTAVFAIVQPPACEPNQFTDLTKKVIRGNVVPALVVANGGLTVHLDVEGANAAVAYIGRLEGTAPVAEHAHDSSWEVLCAVEAKGTLTVAGVPQRVTSHTCAKVPPRAKHAWKPDEGTTLVAVQFYTPPGPEQRFKAMARADAGARPASP